MTDKKEEYKCTALPMPLPCHWIGCKWECQPNKCPFYKKAGDGNEN